MYEYKATVVRIIDGDTIEALIDLGFHTLSIRKIRLFGIDAWESRTRDLEEKVKGLAAKERISELIFPLGGESSGEIRLVSHGLDKYGRSLGTIFVGDVDVNQTLLNEGHAVPYEK